MAQLAPRSATQPGGEERLYAAHAAATTWYREQLRRHHEPADYLRRRGLEMIVDRETPWRVGFAPRAWTALTDHLRGRGFTDDELLRGGLAFRSRDGRLLDLFRDRITFPIRDQDGRTVAFTARLWHNPTGDSSPPKYINSPDTPIYRKSEHLFGLAEQRDRITGGYPPVIVEGPTDALAIWTAYTGTSRTGLVALATCGTALTTTQLATAADLPGSRRYGLAVAFDGDSAGRAATRRAHALIDEHQPQLVVRGTLFAEGADPGQLGSDPTGRARLRAVLRAARPLLHLVIEDRIDTMLARRPTLFHEVESRVQLARTLAPLIAEQTPPAASAALRYFAEHALARLEHSAQAADLVAQAVHSLTFAVADHLETGPNPHRPSQTNRPPPSGQPAATAFPAQPLAAPAPTRGGAPRSTTIRPFRPAGRSR